MGSKVRFWPPGPTLLGGPYVKADTRLQLGGSRSAERPTTELEGETTFMSVPTSMPELNDTRRRRLSNASSQDDRHLFCRAPDLFQGHAQIPHAQSHACARAD